MTRHTGDFDREWTAGLLLLAVGVGTRLTFTILYPTMPFWYFLQVVHFGVVLRDQELFAPGWHWSQFNPGLPVLLSLIFRLFREDPIATARTATAVATGFLSPGLTPTWARLGAATAADWSGEGARVRCALPVVEPDESLVLKLYDLASASGPWAAATVSVRVGERAPVRQILAAGLVGGLREVEIPGAETPTTPNATVELRGAAPGRTGPPERSASVSLAFERRSRATEPPAR